MATYTTTVPTKLPQTVAFGYMADLRNFAEWDPGVRSVEQLVGDGGGPDAEFLVVTDGGRDGVEFRYRTIEYDRPRSVTVEATTRWFTSRDRVDVERNEDDSSAVVYHAELGLNGVLRFFDPLLRPVFRRIAGRAEAGLRRALGAES